MHEPGESLTATHAFETALKALSRRDLDEALALLQRAELLGHDADECAAGRWECFMLAGQFERAWSESDHIAGRGKPDPHRLWDGLPFTGKRVLIRCLHGLGDAIQFARYAKLVRREASHVIVQTHPELVPLMQHADGVDEAVTWPDSPSLQWDQQIEVMELPRAFRTTLATVPHEVPYIRLPQSVQERALPEALQTGAPRIALQWGSGWWNEARSLALAELAPLLECTGFDYFTLQMGEARRQLESLPGGYRIHDIATPDVLEAAARLMKIDLLITVDTMMAHLGGALGRPVWLLLPYEADWRWMVDRDDSPWYPTMTLFRQSAPGDWGTVVQAVCAELPALRESNAA